VNIYSACNSKSDYETYLKNFPSGNHVADANSRIAIIKEHNKKVLKYVLIAIGLIILFVVIVSSANEMNKKVTILLFLLIMLRIVTLLQILQMSLMSNMNQSQRILFL
jgi:hypothetical protein